MTAIGRLVWGAAAWGLLAGPATAADGVLIVQKVSTGGAPTTHQIQIEPHRMRAETAGRAARPRSSSSTARAK